MSRILLFLALTALFTWTLPWQHSPLPGGAMWGPGLAAVVLQLLTRRSLAGLGWRPGPWRYWLLAVALPLAYAGPAYLAGWLSGLAPLRPDLMAWIADVLNTQLGLPAMPDWALVPVFVAAVMTLAMALNLAAATGEEIGWRGWLQPALSQRWGPRRAALAVGAIWAAWHWPGILFDGDHASTPVWFGGAMFSLMILAMSVPLAWLTWRSGSLWPAAVFHAVHNVAIQGALGPVTAPDGAAPWLVGEFGAWTAALAMLVAWPFWRRLPSAAPA